MNHIKLKDIAIYHPDHIVPNQFYLDHFQQKGEDITKLLTEVLGRENRFIINNDEENTLTMGIQAAQNVLNQCGLTGSDIDIIFFATQTPESTIPTNAMRVHQAIGADSDTLSMDINTNCTGMLVAIDQASRTMQSNHQLERALIIGSDYLSLFSSPEDPITYANFGDAACAIILEKTEENSGFVDALYEVDTSNVNSLTFPLEGLSNSIKRSNPYPYVKEVEKPRDTMPETFTLMENLLDKHGLTMNDIDVICPSQFVFRNVQRIREKYQFDENQVLFVGDKYGYTGLTSPLLAFYEGIQSGKINRGDTILFYTIGSGHMIIAMLFKY